FLDAEAGRIGRAAEVREDVGQPPSVEDAPSERVIEVNDVGDLGNVVGVVEGEDVGAVIGENVARVILPVVAVRPEVFNLSLGSAVGVGGGEGQAMSEAFPQ